MPDTPLKHPESGLRPSYVRRPLYQIMQLTLKVAFLLLPVFAAIALLAYHRTPDKTETSPFYLGYKANVGITLIVQLPGDPYIFFALIPAAKNPDFPPAHGLFIKSMEDFRDGGVPLGNRIFVYYTADIQSHRWQWIPLCWSKSENGYHFLAVPLPVALAACFLPLFTWNLRRAVRWTRRARRSRRSQCTNCGYDLRVSPNRCPECDSSAHPHSES